MAENGNTADEKAVTDVEAKIIRQIEYYFGDHNLARDKFMQGVVKADGGWLPLETLVKFNRLKTLSTDYKVITDALKKSETGLLEVSEDGQKIRRSPENQIPDFDGNWKQEVEDRTVYVKGFPQTMTLDELLEYFQEHGTISSIYMRRHFQKKTFKGSVYVSFKTKEAADEFMKKEKVSHSQIVLKREMRKDYTKRKAEEREEYQKRKQQKREQREKETEEGNSVKTEEENQKGIVLHMSGFGKDTAREDIKNVFATFSTIKWVLFQRGQTEAWVQFSGENAAAAALEKVMEGKDGQLEIKGAQITCSVVEGDDEQTALEKINQQREEVLGKMKGHRNRGGGGRGRGRHQRKNNSNNRQTANVKFQGKKRKFSDDDDDEVDSKPSEKEARTDSVKTADDVPSKMVKVEATEQVL